MSLRLMFLGAIVAAGIPLHSPPSAAQDADAKPATKESIGYFLGFSVGQQMSQSGLRIADFDLQTFTAGFSDGLSKKEPTLAPEQLRATQKHITALVDARQETLQKDRQAMASEQKAKGQQWLATNAKKKGVKILDGGLQYEVLTVGKGDTPTATDRVRVHYTGKLISGEVFDSSVERGKPAEFGVGQVIRGWTIALQKMRVGDKWRLYIPSDLAYGERGSPPKIGPSEVLIFEVELLGIL